MVAPMTTGRRDYPWCVAVAFQGKSGHIALDQLRTVDEARVSRVVGQLDNDTAARVLQTLAELFEP